MNYSRKRLICGKEVVSSNQRTFTHPECRLTNDDSKVVEQKEGEGKFGEWVSKEETLPGNFISVLVFTIHGNMTVGNLCYEGTKWNLNSDEPFGFNFVTHWMHLPTAPIINKK